MKLAVDFAMLERQIDLGDEERRAVYRLSDMLDTMNSAGLITDPETYRRIQADLNAMDRSVSFRQSWLETVRDTFERLRRENLDRFDLEQEKLRKLLS